MSDSAFFAGRDQRAVAEALERAGLAAEYQQIFLDNEVSQFAAQRCTKKMQRKKNQKNAFAFLVRRLHAACGAVRGAPLRARRHSARRCAVRVSPLRLAAALA